MNLKHWISGVSLAVALGLVAACGGGGDDDPTAEPTSDGPEPTATPETLNPQQIVERLKNSVVNIKAVYPEGEGGGSGIVWEDGNHVLTNAHVVLGAGSIKVVDPANGRELPATVVGVSQCDDVALLQVERANLTPATIGDSDAVATGEEVVALGFPGTLAAERSQLTVTRGIVSKTGDSYEGLQDLIQTDAAINPGNSGGPLVNLRGEVIGMNSLSFRSRQNINYAISMNEAKFVADKLKDGTSLNYIGLRLEDNYPGLADELGIFLAYTDGVLVTGVDTGGPGEDAGFYYSDLIYYVDNVFVDNVGEVCDVLRSRSTGDEVRIDITRNYGDGTYEDLFTTLTIGE